MCDIVNLTSRDIIVGNKHYPKSANRPKKIISSISDGHLAVPGNSDVHFYNRDVSIENLPPVIKGTVYIVANGIIEYIHDREDIFAISKHECTGINKFKVKELTRLI